jgi:hypothetical protein
VNGTPGLVDCTPWGMAAFGCDNTTFRALRYYNLPESAPFTYGCFCRFDSTSATTKDALSRGDISTHNGAFSLGIGSTALRFRAALRLGGTLYTAQMSTSITARQWYFIAITYDNTSLRLYVDGLNVATTNISLSFTASSQHFRIAARSTGTANWEGAVGASFGWTRLLSEDELTQIAQDYTVSWLTCTEPPGRGWLTAAIERVTGQADLQGVGSLSAVGRTRLFSGAALSGVGAISADGGLAGTGTLIITAQAASSESAQKSGVSDGSARIGAGEGVSRRGGKA